MGLHRSRCKLAITAVGPENVLRMDGSFSTRAVDLRVCREAFRFLEAVDGPEGWRLAWARVAPADRATTPSSAPEPAPSWRLVANLLETVDPWAAAGPAAMAIRWGIPVTTAFSEAPLEIVMARTDIPRLRLRLAARGFAPKPGGWLRAADGGTLVPRGRVLPAAFGSVPVLAFIEGATSFREDGIPLAEPAAGTALALLRAGAELLAGGPLAAWHLVEAAVLESQAISSQRTLWNDRLTAWGLGPFSEALRSLTAVVAGIEEHPTPAAERLLRGQGPLKARVRLAAPLLEGTWRRLRLVMTARPGQEGWL